MSNSFAVIWYQHVRIKYVNNIEYAFNNNKFLFT